MVNYVPFFLFLQVSDGKLEIDIKPTIDNDTGTEMWNTSSIETLLWYSCVLCLITQTKLSRRNFTNATSTLDTSLQTKSPMLAGPLSETVIPELLVDTVLGAYSAFYSKLSPKY